MKRRAGCALFALAFGILPLLDLAPAHGLAARGTHSAQRPACVYDHMTMRTLPGICRPRAIRYPPNVRGGVKRSIYDSALTFGMPYKVLYAVAKCESSLNPKASYLGHYGLYQFLPDTFRRAAAELQREMGVTATSYWSALDASYAAGYLFVTGESRNWTCEKRAVQHPVG
jgi:hypothetical protein